MKVKLMFKLYCYALKKPVFTFGLDNNLLENIFM